MLTGTSIKVSSPITGKKAKELIIVKMVIFMKEDSIEI
jgi:hypothetical protein